VRLNGQRAAKKIMPERITPAVMQAAANMNLRDCGEAIGMSSRGFISLPTKRFLRQGIASGLLAYFLEKSSGYAAELPTRMS